MKKREEIYLRIFDSDEGGSCLAPIETLICLFTMRYCESRMRVKFVRTETKPEVRGYSIIIGEEIEHSSSREKTRYYANSCELPNVTVDGDTVVAGLCASLRQIVKAAIRIDPEHRCRSLLGFKDSCLSAPAETSIWTKYCEVDLIATLNGLTRNSHCQSPELPESVARFEAHMSEPSRLHNAYKYTMSKKFAPNGVVSREEKGVVPEHSYAEGSFLTLSDIIIFVCFHVLFDFLAIEKKEETLPLSAKWYERMMKDPTIIDCLGCIVREPSKISEIRYVLPVVEKRSLYKTDPKRYKPRSRLFTRQEDVEKSLDIIGKSMIDAELNSEPYGREMTIDWSSIPREATPDGGSLPIARLRRKYEQLENLCKPVLRLAKDNDVIVDFCSGSGHLGILVAYLLPKCQIVLLENKEESLNRSKERVEKLQLKNVKFYQCNLDYFEGYFDIGTSLHACGVATDLVIQHCIRRNAVFVSCPCCYGSVHDSHRIAYPRSQIFEKSIGKRDYLIIGHSADQTHDSENAKTAQGNECMAIIDTDRKLQAQEFGYRVYLAKLVPETCTPKNHLLVGIPKDKL